VIKLAKKLSLFLLWLNILTYSHILCAELTIEITEGVKSAHKIAVVPFATPLGEQLPVDVAQIISADLASSGYFTALARAEMLTQPSRAAHVKFRNWAAIGQDYLVIGFIKKDNNLYHVQMSLFDVYKKEQLKGLRVTVEVASLRMAAHHLSNAIYAKLMGISGNFTTRIAYVTSFENANKQMQYNLNIADYDGENAISIAQSKEPIMSPAWSPDGEKIAYVSFENKVSEIFVQTLTTGERISIAKYKGINGAPAWSPDGKKIAMTLSKAGNSDIYIMTLANRSLRKLTHSWAIDTEATWSPDGKQILFTSNRGRRPQLYIMASNGQGTAERVTFDGDYNARGVFSPDGKSIAMVQGLRGNYRIAVLDLEKHSSLTLTEGRLDESPSFAPNGKTIIYARRKGDKELLAMVAVDGSTKQDISNTTGVVREPAWSPLQN
jgi:TolB protein